MLCCSVAGVPDPVIVSRHPGCFGMGCTLQHHGLRGWYPVIHTSVRRSIYPLDACRFVCSLSLSVPASAHLSIQTLVETPGERFFCPPPMTNPRDFGLDPFFLCGRASVMPNSVLRWRHVSRVFHESPEAGTHRARQPAGACWAVKSVARLRSVLRAFPGPPWWWHVVGGLDGASSWNGTGLGHHHLGIMTVMVMPATDTREKLDGASPALARGCGSLRRPITSRDFPHPPTHPDARQASLDSPNVLIRQQVEGNRYG